MAKRLPRPLRRLLRSFQVLIGTLLQFVFRFLFSVLSSQKRQTSDAGFVLPTATLVLLVVSLLVGSLIIRTGEEAEEAISQQAQQEIYNAATPAVARAKAKIEFLFQQDNRFPVGIPSEELMNSIMLNDGNFVPAQDTDPYTLSDETRLDINGDGNDDNAWSYETDTDGDGSNDTTVAYAITMLTSDGNGTTIESLESEKANSLVVRSGPLNASVNSEVARCEELATLNSSDGWYSITGSTLRKNLQINAVVRNNNELSTGISALELQQDRDLETGNKWGAWFGYDLEFTPGSNFNWNGAMHTEGSLLVNNNGGNTTTTSLRLVSSPASCLYSKEASQITLAENKNENGEITFQGQVIRADTDNDEFETDKDNQNQVKIDLFPGGKEKPSADTNTLNLSLADEADSGEPADSVSPGNEATPSQYMLDPVQLVSENIAQARNPGDATNQTIRDSDWEDNPLRERIFNQSSRKPHVDDTYRADDRWGPNAQYSQAYPVTASNNGTLISSQPILKEIPSAIADAENAGFDGYWERRARVEGMRIIVGQRLHLGNENGWEGNNDPLYPANANTDLDDDHRAAVQSAVVYHWDGYQREPAACLAMTGHPGNSDSTNFDNIDINGTTFLETDFFTGKGTNGWEFPFYSDFSTDVDTASSTLRKALKNLAYFAGDPNGAFPPTQKNGGTVTHPYPELTMWGDFSNLRRAIDQLEGTNYSDLSLADQTTLQTATCTLGMLAYNLDFKQEELEQRVSSSGESLQSEGTELSRLVDGTCSTGNPEIIDPSLYNGGTTCSEALFDGSNWTDEIDNSDSDSPYYVPDCDSDSLPGFDKGCDEPEVYRLFTTEELLDKAGFDSTEIPDLTNSVKAITQGNQIMRDRRNGFAWGGPQTVPSTVSGANFNYDPATSLAGPRKVAEQDNVYIRTGCDPDIFGEVTASGAAQIGLALAFCRDSVAPKYPSLFYLFPIIDHDHDGDTGDGNAQPTTESYINDTYISDSNVNGSYTYQVLTDSEINDLALTPRNASDFVLPTATSDTNIGNEITQPDSSALFVSFLDKAIYNDREQMDVRVLDIDLNLLRSNKTTNTTKDYWLPTSENNREVGIVYAFREDAIREDGIARPRKENWSNCSSEEMLTGIDPTTGDVTSETTSDNCRMRPGIHQDPPLNDNTGVSAKPVDSYADPDRHPYGFRLKNGSDLSRSNSDLTGLSFISDQPVYIQGDFNTHSQEEFTDTSESFYDRDALNTNFATAGGDSWRPTEIIADGITLLSTDFVDQATTNAINSNSTGNLEVNSILVSGLIPSLPRQYNGGIHNFPRFLENWNNTVTIKGSFIQLNFSKYATGPYDQENTNPAAPTNLNAGVNIPYYSPPTREWGYDVALQYQSPGPVAERFITVSSPRRETYRELSVDDPYIKNLLDALD